MTTASDPYVWLTVAADNLRARAKKGRADVHAESMAEQLDKAAAEIELLRAMVSAHGGDADV